MGRDYANGSPSRALNFPPLQGPAHERGAHDRGPPGAEPRGAGRDRRARHLGDGTGVGQCGLRSDRETDPEAATPACAAHGLTRAHGVALPITAARSKGARLRHSFFKSSTSAARNVPRMPSVVISNAGSSFFAELLEYRAITARSSNR